MLRPVSVSMRCYKHDPVRGCASRMNHVSLLSPVGLAALQLTRSQRLGLGEVPVHLVRWCCLEVATSSRSSRGVLDLCSIRKLSGSSFRYIIGSFRRDRITGPWLVQSGLGENPALRALQATKLQIATSFDSPNTENGARYTDICVHMPYERRSSQPDGCEADKHSMDAIVLPLVCLRVFEDILVSLLPIASSTCEEMAMT